MTNITTWEDENRFGLSFLPSFRDPEDLGHGGNLVSHYFSSHEARAMFISMTKTEETLRKLLNDAESEIRYLKTIKGANANLREVRKRSKENA